MQPARQFLQHPRRNLRRFGRNSIERRAIELDDPEIRERARRDVARLLLEERPLPEDVADVDDPGGRGMRAADELDPSLLHEKQIGALVTFEKDHFAGGTGPAEGCDIVVVAIGAHRLIISRQ